MSLFYLSTMFRVYSYQAVYTFPCLPPSSSLKNVKKKHQKYIAELELEPSVVAHFTHPQTRVTARLPKAAVAAAGGSCAVRLAAQHPHDVCPRGHHSSLLFSLLFLSPSLSLSFLLSFLFPSFFLSFSFLISFLSLSLFFPFFLFYYC